MGRDQIGHYHSILKAVSQDRALQSRLVHPVFARSHKSKAMLSFTHSSDSYDGADRENRGDHDIIMAGYANCVGGSPLARMKEILGDLLRPTGAGDDAHVPYGRALSVILHAALPGKGWKQSHSSGTHPRTQPSQESWRRQCLESTRRRAT